MADDDDWESAWDSGAAEARLVAQLQPDPEKIKKRNKEIWDSANTPTPEIHYSQPQKPVYKPDLQILRRPTQSPSPQPSTPTLSKQEEENLRIEREKKYEEARDRIFGRASPASTSTMTTEKKVWDPKERGMLPVRPPRGPTAAQGKGFSAGAGRGKPSKE